MIFERLRSIVERGGSAWVPAGRHEAGRRTATVWSVLVIALIGIGQSASASESYRPEPGDVLEIAVTGIPDLRQQVPIGVSGEISYPLIGHIEVAGMPVAEIQKMIGDLVATKIYQNRIGDGRGQVVNILPEEVTVRVSQYRPVYLRGDVSKPGEQAFRPGLNVRQAIALAGGFDIMRFRMSNPFLEAADLRSEYDSLWLEYARGQARIAHLQAELAGRANLQQPAAMQDLPLPRQITSRIEAIEGDQLRARREDSEKQKAFYRNGLKQAEEQAQLLRERLNQEADGVEADRRDLEVVKSLVQRGTIPITRLTEARRSSLLSSTQWLQTTVQAEQSKRQVDEMKRQLEKVDDDRRLAILAELQEANVKLAATRNRLNAVSEKLLYTGAVKTQLVRGKGNEPTIVIYRKGQGSAGQFKADENTVLQPADVVDVLLDVAPLDVVSGGEAKRASN